MGASNQSNQEVQGSIQSSLGATPRQYLLLLKKGRNFKCLFLFATMVVTAPIRARRENVLSFLNDALDTTTEKTIPENTTAYRNPPSKPVKEQYSEDMSEAKSTESFDTNRFTGPGVSDKNGGESRGLDSDEIVIPKVVEKDKAPLRRKTKMRLMDMSSRLVQDQGSREHGGPHGAHQASRERTDLNSEEGVTVDAQKIENLSGKQVISLSRDRVTSSLQRKAAPGRVHELNGMLVPVRSRELLDPDSLEDNIGRPAPVGNRGDADYDETREFLSSEMYPKAPPEHMPSSFSVPAKSQAS
ncbi:uncharacterized protein LOC114557683 isoform X2 [Perca flavescens]|uniref:uncharacterized protein LOC114557683 isoform X2 n=1 Tax=Perca flavescens TaxID=8167 RepID=UPI00106EEADB|nr:uncharacterized protein LOC114557683 isoform X2 [Perca flavescens]